ncbi:MAG: hypothetical protein ACFCVE_11800 [Phycisphaerae bacterium]
MKKQPSPKVLPLGRHGRRRAESSDRLAPRKAGPRRDASATRDGLPPCQQPPTETGWGRYLDDRMRHFQQAMG